MSADPKCPEFNVGLELELYFRRLNVKYATFSQIFTNAFHTEVRHVSFPRKPVLSLARPNFLTGAITETRSQASLPAPSGLNCAQRFDYRALGTELNNVCACARVKRRNPILSVVRVDFLFCSFDVLFIWFVPRNGP